MDNKEFLKTSTIKLSVVLNKSIKEIVEKKQRIRFEAYQAQSVPIRQQGFTRWVDTILIPPWREMMNK